MMMITGVEDGGNNDAVSFPRGGPIYVPDMVSTTLTRVSNFESSVIQQLQNLHTLLNSNPTESDNNNNNDEEKEDILVEELKIITDEELARQALEEAFNNDQNEDKDSDQLSNKKKMKKNHREIESTGYIAKVENFVKIKQKQGEEKAAARLHSFNGSSIRTTESALETERLTTLSSLGRVTNLNLLNLRGDDEHVQVIYPEVILCVEVYNSKKTWVKTQEFLVLGCQLLTELKDKICCSTDQVMRNAGKYDPSGYFLIEDVFCNDLRDSAEAVDYSEPILNWLRDSKDEALEKWECIVSGEFQKQQKRLKALVGNAVVPSQLPSFRAVEMQKTRFCDLRFRVGAGYVYCHQGDCKHIMVVRDMRLIHPEDVQNRRVYPIITFQMKERLQKCSVCKIYKAEKVTVDDKWAAENPCYFCKNCYYMLHYDNGSLLYEEFSVYDYIHE